MAFSVISETGFSAFLMFSRPWEDCELWDLFLAFVFILVTPLFVFVLNDGLCQCTIFRVRERSPAPNLFCSSPCSCLHRYFLGEAVRSRLTLNAISDGRQQ